MSSLIQKMAATREKTLQAAKALPKPEEEYLTGLFEENGELSIREPKGAPLFAGEQWFVIDNPEHDPARRTPTHKIVSCPLRVDDKGKPIPASPVSSHAYEIGAIWHRQGVSESTGKPWEIYSGTIVNIHDEESVLLAQEGKLISQDCKKLKIRLQFPKPESQADKINRALVGQVRDDMTEEQIQELREKVAKTLPVAMFWVEKVPTQKKLAELASAQAEASGKVGGEKPSASENALMPAGVSEDVGY